MRRLIAAIALLLGASLALSGETAPARPSVPPLPAATDHPGYRLLVDKAYLPPDFDQETFDAVWRAWPEPLRSRAEEASPAERRAMAYARYGLTPRPDDPARPLQYVVGPDGGWSMNCFACHGGKVAGAVVPGLPNTHLALDSLTSEIRTTKILLGKPLARMDLGSLIMPLGGSHGTTNAVMFGVALLHGRDAELRRVHRWTPPPMTHHDMDAPAWWFFDRKERLYSDGFATRNARALMQFMLVPQNSREQLDAWEADYETVFSYLESIEAPRWPWGVDAGLAREGERVFRQNCATCHGTYGDEPRYPNRIVDWEEVRTDPVRLRALTVEQRAAYGRSWFARFGEDEVVADPGGYVAPPLDGIWASAPYLHNGSVPTLWHLLRPERRPALWRRAPDGYDRARVGLEFVERDALPESARRDDHERRAWFDTTRTGKSAAGHDFPAALTEEERVALLEYLKTL